MALAPGSVGEKMRKELLIGCGAKRDKRVSLPGREAWEELITLDVNDAHKPDVLWDLEQLPYPFDSNSMDEIHAYEVLEHIGAQGEYGKFFAQFSELWRILKPGGHLMATVPMFNSPWAWGDPSHKRIITVGTLAFLSQAEYARQVGVTPMSDFRFAYKADFKTVFVYEGTDTLTFVLEALK